MVRIVQSEGSNKPRTKYLGTGKRLYTPVPGVVVGDPDGLTWKQKRDRKFGKGGIK